jgi:hypothetical protein
MDNEKYIDLMASSALLGILASGDAERLGFGGVVINAYTFADLMWDEREARRKARAALEKKETPTP